MEEKQAEAYSHEAPPPYESQPPELQPMFPKQPVGYGPQIGYATQGQPGYPSQGQPGYPPQGQPGYPPPGQLMYTAQGYPVTQQPCGPGQPAVVVINQPPGLTDPPSTYLRLAIFVTLCCCWPIGIFAILRASSCKNAIGRGDRVAAERLSRESKRLSVWSLAIGIVFNVLSFGVIVTVYALYVIPSLQLY